MSQSWHAAFAPAEAPLRCGEAEHRLRWAGGKLQAVDHPDAEGELVLAALGGDTSQCLDLVMAWGRHSDDLTVLAVGPRSASDPVAIPAAVQDELDALSDPAAQGQHGTGNLVAYRRRSGHASVPVGATVSMVHAYGPASVARSRRPIPRQVLRQAVLRRARLRTRSTRWSGSRPLGWSGSPLLGMYSAGIDEARLELIRLLALGPRFQFRLSAAVAHAWSANGEHASRAERARPALTAALAGRLTPAAAEWLGIDPGIVQATIHDGVGWGEIAPASTGGTAVLPAKLPVGWLAEVWAPGFAVVDSHLVVAVLQADWPQARVLALRSPGQDPVELGIRQDQEHWSVTSRSRVTRPRD